jgi:hypothetical protein
VAATDSRHVERIGVLKPEECARIAAEVKRLRDHWIPRDDAGMYSLGAALYLDAPVEETQRYFGIDAPPPGQYQANLERTKGLLAERFDWLYERLRGALSERLQAEVRYCPDLALPGFHVFLSSSRYEHTTGHVPHFDRQYECIDWEPGLEIDFRISLSFTLPIELPPSGGGLKTWDVDLFEVLAMTREEAKEMIRRKTPRRHAYALGELVCHSGHRLHQIESWPAGEGEQRITLQGHALAFEGAWNLYW